MRKVGGRGRRGGEGGEGGGGRGEEEEEEEEEKEVKEEEEEEKEEKEKKVRTYSLRESASSNTRYWPMRAGRLSKVSLKNMGPTAELTTCRTSRD